MRPFIFHEVGNPESIVSDKVGSNQAFRIRRASRVLAVRPDGLLAVQELRAHSFPSLPGGGIELGEEVETAMKREVLEETGWRTGEVASIGQVIEYRKESGLIQINYCYLVELQDKVADLQLEKDEIDEGLHLYWMMVDDAITFAKSLDPKIEKGRYIKERTIFLLNWFKESMDP